ncbi:Ltp family lipoprotein [Staphylococcus sp. Mo2-1]
MMNYIINLLQMLGDKFTEEEAQYAIDNIED